MRAYFALCAFVVAIVFGTLSFESWSKHQVAIAAFNYEERTRPSFNELCTMYFEWSKMMKKRVPSMEEQCGAKP